jgi:hypothetical protein
MERTPKVDVSAGDPPAGGTEVLVGKGAGGRDWERLFKYNMIEGKN